MGKAYLGAQRTCDLAGLLPWYYWKVGLLYQPPLLCISDQEARDPNLQFQICSDGQPVSRQDKGVVECTTQYPSCNWKSSRVDWVGIERSMGSKQLKLRTMIIEKSAQWEGGGGGGGGSGDTFRG